MKPQLELLLREALAALYSTEELKALPLVQLERCKDTQHGDYACNIALILAKSVKKNPREVANNIVTNLPPSPYLDKIEVAGPGFINFFLSHHATTEVVSTILTEKENFGRSKAGREKKVLLEFLSSNPTGPLHVGHGRGGAFGAVLANLLETVGFKIYREYYVNDAGRQMDILAVSVWLRYLALCDENIVFPANAYKGEYVIDIAKAIYDVHKMHFHRNQEVVYDGLPKDEPDGGDKEIYIDAMVHRCKFLLKDLYDIIFQLSLDNVLSDIREDLTEFGVLYDNWFSERDFVASNVVDQLLLQLKESGYVYEKEGALWFRSTAFHDAKDRVLVRSNGQRTYFANDIAYHLTKFERGFDIAIDIFGSDHHGYVPRLKAAMAASNINPERLQPILFQFVTLYRNGAQVQMSTRSGSFVTLRELREEVGNDAARFFYIMRKADQHIDFDLDLAKSNTNENPVYYVQYAYARICSVFRELKERNIIYDEAMGLANLDKLTSPHERALLLTLSRYKEMIIDAAVNYEPHQLTHYLRELAGDFHSYYNAHHFIFEDDSLRQARLALVNATRQTLANTFKLIGINARESM